MSRRHWRFDAGLEREDELPPARDAVPGPMPRRLIDGAWLRLLLHHTPFLPVDDREYARLVDRYRELEELVLRDPQLQAYYAESFLPEAARKGWPIAGDAPFWKLHHVATLQAQLMEDVFYAFRLDRHANAPDNRGWMNLFRRWGRSKAFMERFESMRETFSRNFLEFFDYFIRDLDSIDDSPVPHPWDPIVRRPDSREPPPLPPDEQKMVNEIRYQRPKGWRAIPGVYLDSGIRESEPWKPQPPQPTSGEHAAGPAKATPPPAAPGETGGEPTGGAGTSE